MRTATRGWAAATRFTPAALAAASVAVAAVILAGCGSSGPSIDTLKSNHDLPGLVEAAAGSDLFSSRHDDAIEALRELDDPQTYEVIAGVLRTEKYQSGEFAVPGSLVDLLGELGGTEAADVIIAWVREADPGENYWPHTQIVQALAANREAAIAPLAVVLESTPVAKGTTTASAQELPYRRDAELRLVAFEVIEGRWAKGGRVAATGELGSGRGEQALLVVLRAQPDYAPRAGLAVARLRRTEPDLLVGLVAEDETLPIFYGLVRLGSAGTEPALVAALERNAENLKLAERIASVYLNSGNSTLEGAAQSWASSHNRIVIPYCPVGMVCEDDGGSWGTIDEYDD